MGAGESANWPTAVKAVQQWFPPERRGLRRRLVQLGFLRRCHPRSFRRDAADDALLLARGVRCMRRAGSAVGWTLAARIQANTFVGNGCWPRARTRPRFPERRACLGCDRNSVLCGFHLVLLHLLAAGLPDTCAGSLACCVGQSCVDPLCRSGTGKLCGRDCLRVAWFGEDVYPCMRGLRSWALARQ